MTGPIDPALFGMPDATTAGVQAGVTLTNYTGPMTITTAGTVIENVIINGSLRVTAADVTIKNCLIQNWWMWGVDAEGAANITIEYCDFIGGSVDTNAAILGSGTFIGNDIRNSENGIVLQDGASVVRDNYIHDLQDSGNDPHYDGISVQGGQNGVLIEHNTVEARDTSCIFIKNDFGPINNIMVRDNLLYSDEEQETAATIYVYGPNTTNVSILNNYVEKGFWFYYAIDNANPTISGNIEWEEGVDPTPYPGPPVDRFPDAVNDSASTAHNTAATINALANDSLGDTPTVVSAFDAATANGGAVSYSNGSFTYTPAVNWSGTDAFAYTIQDTDGDVDSATVSVTVAPPAPPPGVTLIGTNGSNTLHGGAGNDTIDGRGGWDWLYGEGGNDRIIGGTGNDDLFGGSGADTFDYNAANESPRGVGQRDFIHDFEVGVDKIDLSTIDAKSNVSGNQAFTFLGEGTFNSGSSQPGLLKYHYETVNGGARTVIEATANTSSGVDLQISLLGHHVLTASDFIL